MELHQILEEMINSYNKGKKEMIQKRIKYHLSIIKLILSEY